MKLLLISFNQQDIGACKRAPTDISSIGARYLSSYLKDRGHKVNMLFLPKRHGKEESRNELKQINNLISQLKPDLIGFSLMSNHFFRARNLTNSIKSKFNIPIIWGGIHPTIQPFNCMEYADLICVGDGELAMAELLSRNSLEEIKDLDIRGIWQKDNGRIIDKGAAPLLENLDNAPFPDYNFEDHYIIHKGRLRPLAVEIFKQYYPFSRGDYRIIASRGCPHACNYCCNSALRLMYRGTHFRKRTASNVINEMLEIKNKFPFVRFFKINDDTFLANDIEWLKEFGRQYKEKINLPFYCLASPTTLSKEKLEVLVDAGLATIQMGLQTGSDRVNREIYARNVSNVDFLEAMRLLEGYKVKVSLDLIVDNPYENEQDMLESIRVLNQLKRGFNLDLYSLAFYPGTVLYDMAIRDKILDSFEEYLKKEFHVFKRTFFNKLFYLLPRFNLTPGTVDKLVKWHKNFFTRVYLNLLFYAYVNKNKMPFWLVKILSKFKKIFKKIF